jgi:uncharacterized repeat protein (TIGR03803 family)
MFASIMLRLPKALLVAALAVTLVSTVLGQSKEKVIHTFHGGKDGVVPWSGVIQDGMGNLYGTTGGGGSTDCGGDGCGLVFELSPKAGGGWTEKKLHIFHFDGTDGVFPSARVTIDPAGNLYGTTKAGGKGCSGFGCGMAFELSPNGDGTWKETVLHEFNHSDGSAPAAALVLDAAGNLYGTAAGGTHGQYGFGVVFELSPNKDGTWTETVLHDFTGGKDGLNSGQLVTDQAGTLYGVTSAGGSYGHGTVFKMSRGGGKWRETVLYDFKPNQNALLPSSVILDNEGGFYGTLVSGQSDGAIFQLKTVNGKWKKTIIFGFNLSDGSWPLPRLVLDSTGNIYGTTEYGGSHGFGVVYELSPTKSGWKQRLLHEFAGIKDGIYPFDGVILGQAGHLYGTTYQGGSSGIGVVFDVTP